MTGPRAAALAAALAVAGLPAVSPAQDTAPGTPFDAAMDAALVDAGNAASLLRCTGLFRAFRVFAGEDTELGRNAAERETDLAVTAVVVWQAETGTEETQAAFDVIVPMVTGATDLYLARMSETREAAGTVFDATLETELTFCDTLHGEIAARMEE